MPVWKKKEEEDELGRIKKFHPLKTMVYCIIAGICMLFFTMMALFAANNPARHLGGQHFPKWFFLSTAIILLSSFSMQNVRQNFDKDDGDKMLRALFVTLVLALLFCVAQFFGWKELWLSQITLYGIGTVPHVTPTASGAFLYIISGLHILHLLGGLIFLFITMFKVVNMRSDPVKNVIYFSNRLEKTRVEMLVKYWHFLGGLWVLLFLYFLWFFV